MSVLRCDRNGCENIMCARYSHKYGYICYECFRELTEVYCGDSIQEFMDSMKKESHDSNNFKNYCDSEFEYRG